MSKLPPILDALFDALTSSVEEPKNPTEQMIEQFTAQMREVCERTEAVLAKRLGVERPLDLHPSVVHAKIKPHGHNALVAGMMTTEQAAAAATVLYRLTQDEAWLKAATFYTDLHPLLKVSHDEVCGKGDDRPGGDLFEKLKTEFFSVKKQAGKA